MIARIVHIALRQKLLVVALAAAVIPFGVVQLDNSRIQLLVDPDALAAWRRTP